jgi:ubiquinone biosynthesis protein Coq4
VKKIWLSLRGLLSFLVLVVKPERLDTIVGLAQPGHSSASLEKTLRWIKAEPSRRAQWEVKPQEVAVDLERLRRMPPGSLGRKFADHMIRNSLKPQFFPAVQAHDACTALQIHLFQTHDIWHVFLGFDVSVEGELGLMAFWANQLPTMRLPPLVLGIGLLNADFFQPAQVSKRIQAIADGWKMAGTTRWLPGVNWNELWERDLEDLREEYRIPPKVIPDGTDSD